MAQKILLIDDDPGVRDFLQEFFQDRGFNVDTAPDGEQGVARFEAGGEYALVVSDMMMPRMIGLEVLRRIKALKPDQKVILMTGVQEQSMVDKAKALGCLHYLTKPVRLTDVQQKVNECFENGPS